MSDLLYVAITIVVFAVLTLIVGLIAAVILSIYLIHALVRPEKP